MTDANTPSLEDDLLATSEKTHHAAVAAYQVHQRSRMQDVEDQLSLWVHDEIMKGEYDETMTDFVIITHTEKMRSILWKETEAFIEIMEMQKRERDKAIKIFVARATPLPM